MLLLHSRIEGCQSDPTFDALRYSSRLNHDDRSRDKQILNLPALGIIVYCSVSARLPLQGSHRCGHMVSAQCFQRELPQCRCWPLDPRSLRRFRILSLGVRVGFSPESRNSQDCVHNGRLAVQLIEQRLGVVEVGGVEAVGEPAVDFGEHRARFVAFALLRRAVARDSSWRAVPRLSPSSFGLTRWPRGSRPRPIPYALA